MSLRRTVSSPSIHSFLSTTVTSKALNQTLVRTLFTSNSQNATTTSSLSSSTVDSPYPLFPLAPPAISRLAAARRYQQQMSFIPQGAFSGPGPKPPVPQPPPEYAFQSPQPQHRQQRVDPSVNGRSLVESDFQTTNNAIGDSTTSLLPKDTVSMYSSSSTTTLTTNAQVPTNIATTPDDSLFFNTTNITTAIINPIHSLERNYFDNNWSPKSTTLGPIVMDQEPVSGRMRWGRTVPMADYLSSERKSHAATNTTITTNTTVPTITITATNTNTNTNTRTSNPSEVLFFEEMIESYQNQGQRGRRDSKDGVKDGGHSTSQGFDLLTAPSSSTKIVKGIRKKLPTKTMTPIQRAVARQRAERTQ